MRRWLQGQRSGAAPASVKREAVRAYAVGFALTTLIETGTYFGEMVWAQRHHFRRIVSIELSRTYASNAQRRFRDSPHIEIRQGDSARELPKILATLEEPALFWLDAHYSGGATARGILTTPIEGELRQVLEDRHGDRHVLLIDDARLFNGLDDYPTLERVREVVRAVRPAHTVSVVDDIIRIQPDYPQNTVVAPSRAAGAPAT